MRNLEFAKGKKLSTWRKLALGTWASPQDPSTYGLLELDATEVLNELKILNQELFVKVTLTHFFGKVIADLLEQRPHLNSLVRLGNLYQRKNITLFFQVAMDSNGHDLGGVRIFKANRISLTQIAEKLSQKVKNLRQGENDDLSASKNVFSLLPSFLIRPCLVFADFLQYGLNIKLPALGLVEDAFGSVMISNIGGHGLDVAWAPLVPMGRVPMVFVLGQVRSRPWNYQGRVELRPILRVGVTVDHRVLDGVEGSLVAKFIEEAFLDPAKKIKEWQDAGDRP